MLPEWESLTGPRWDEWAAPTACSEHPGGRAVLTAAPACLPAGVLGFLPRGTGLLLLQSSLGASVPSREAYLAGCVHACSSPLSN